MTTVCLLGNPNTGKTSLFNALTGSYETVGNWSGVTVEKKLGTLRQKAGKIIDLPGIYDLSPLSHDETIVTRFLLEERFDSILNIVDASQLERNLQLTVQLLEHGAPIVMGLNMVDVAANRGIRIQIPAIARKLHIPILPVVARTGKGTDEILAAITEKSPAPARGLILPYGEAVDKAISELQPIIEPHIKPKQQRWFSVQFFSGNEAMTDFLKRHNLLTDALIIRGRLQEKLETPLELHFYQIREAFIADICLETVEYTKKHNIPLSDKLDRAFTHPWLGIPLFLLVMYLIFQVTFTWIGVPLSDLLDGFFGGTLSDWVTSGLTFIGASQFIIDLIVSGIIAGVGGVLVFIPQILVLFFFISLLEDSGYMARIAVVMDRVMEFFGLNGKAFIPMIIGFGCNVPGIMAARSIEESKERTLTILVTPFMSCSARLPVYALFAGVFFAQNQALVVLSFYVIGIVLALLVTKILSVTLLKKDNSVFVIELPPYRAPSFRTLWRSTWEKGRGFLRKAGTFIFAGSVIIWLLNYTGPTGFNVPMGESFLAIFGSLLAPILAPLGFGTWQAGATLIPGFLAKEVVISTMSIIYATKESTLASVVGMHYTPLSAYCFMLFILLYIPCLATVAAIRKEIVSFKWTAFAVIYPLVTAYVLTLLVYQIGRLFL
ncbi:ferrous iron transport protein B [Listeria newyorkensis]|uniref:Ferrous iron transport protein B n=1 Tax=Listeria newyorkensis TaxID=1497681 RepID=A0ABX4XRH9_9LIST|nr:ferrous iron transport protein B [Listeria newyorkensis]KGL43980.1 ferrous iron transporter B [Listeria newyorkensis]PNP94890.1 ferrous iron transport protein B [Listeria newyorkensis]WAO23345.1 ferrous iron transport protein B [Listeria newyorkensis]SQC59943.1 Ferrous iron transport protein B [Listeria newyorkensis]